MYRKLTSMTLCFRYYLSLWSYQRRTGTKGFQRSHSKRIWSFRVSNSAGKLRGEILFSCCKNTLTCYLSCFYNSATTVLRSHSLRHFTSDDNSLIKIIVPLQTPKEYLSRRAGALLLASLWNLHSLLSRFPGWLTDIKRACVRCSR